MDNIAWPRAGLALAVVVITLGGTVLGTAMFGSPVTTVDHCPDSEYACNSMMLNGDADFVGWSQSFLGMLASLYVVSDLFQRLFREGFSEGVPGQ